MSARDKKIVIVLLGVIVFALAFFFGHRPLNEKKASLNAQNAALRDTYADLSMKAANADMYQKEIKIMNTKMEEIYTHYPSFLQIENEIMDAVELENRTKSLITSLAIADPVAIDIAVGGATEGEAEAVSEGEATTEETTVSSATSYQLFRINTSMSFQSGYEGMKQLVELIATDNDRKSVGTLSAVFNTEEGLINGNLTYDTYFVNGLDKPYLEPTVPSIKHGVNNIFGTIDGAAN